MTDKTENQAVEKTETQGIDWDTTVAKATNYNTVTLDTPLMRGKTEVTEIHVRKPKSGALRGVSLSDVIQMDVQALTRVLPRITEPALTEPELRDMDPADLFQLGNVVSNFLLPKRLKAEAES